VTDSTHSRLARLRWPLLAVAATALLLGAAWWVSGVWSPTPPHSLVLATGPEGSAYAAFGARYREILARSGVVVRLQATEGALDNLGRLRDPGSEVSVGFVQAGTTTAAESPGLASLGTVFYEPLWLFHRGLDVRGGFAGLRGKRLSIGPGGSGTGVLVQRLLALGGVDERFAQLLPLAPEEAAEQLTLGHIDAAAILTSWDALVVRQLLAAAEIELASFPRADAYLALNPYLSRLVLPEGVADLARNVPPADVVLLAQKASLVVRRDLHPALQYLLLEAASEIHSPPALFHRAGQFPAAEAIDLPLGEDARQFYKSGRPFFQRHLPFWAAALVERLLVFLLPLVGVAFPALRSLPGLYHWLARHRIFRFYGELKVIELEMEALPAGEGGEGLRARLAELEDRAGRLRVPAFEAWLAHTLRHHVRLVSERLEQRSQLPNVQESPELQP
jgi:TRAP-type uncharacterized transport system substrate-binding protein